MDIDKLADERTRNRKSTGEKLHDQYLESQPKIQWPAYLDEVARDITSGIQIDDKEEANQGLNLTSTEYPTACGEHYKEGLKVLLGQSSIPDSLSQSSGQELGSVAVQLNELADNLSTGDRTDWNHVGELVWAATIKSLVREGDMRNPSQSVGGQTVSDVMVELFSTSSVADNREQVLKTFESMGPDGIRRVIDAPLMMTRLWEHQLDALQEWQNADCQGYADMATATGKTILGLSAIAFKYSGKFGGLHPHDESNLTSDAHRETRPTKEDVLIVADNTLVLQQWREEFERHMGIPQTRLNSNDSVDLSWGTIEFRTAQDLHSADAIPQYDLVLLDEVHHYTDGGAWGDLLSSFDCEILGLSGSLSNLDDGDAIAKRLESNIGERISHYTIEDAKSDGIIPDFNWSVTYAPASSDSLSEFAELTQKCETGFEIHQPKLLDLLEDDNASERHFKTYKDIKSFSRTNTGQDLKQSDAAFREFVSSLFARQTAIWRQSPSIDSVVNIASKHVEDSHVLILADRHEQVDDITTALQNQLNDSHDRIFKLDTEEPTKQRETVKEFDETDGPAVLVGVGARLGEGVDIKKADVAINMATGGANQSLIQRLGRVLRNPDGVNKKSMFYHVVPIPLNSNAIVPREDGVRILQQANEYANIGQRIRQIPRFEYTTTEVLQVLEHLEQGGVDRINWLNAGGELNESDSVIEGLQSICPDGTGSSQTPLTTLMSDSLDYGGESGRTPGKTQEPKGKTQPTVSEPTDDSSSEQKSVDDTELKKLSSEELRGRIIRLFEREGFRVNTPSLDNNWGVNVIARSSEETRLLCIEADSETVTISPLIDGLTATNSDQFRGNVVAHIITLGEFTEAAREKAENEPRLKVWNGESLIKALNKYTD